MLVNVDSQKSLSLRQRQRFKLKEQNKLKVDPKHLAHYTLSWITCVNNYCNLYYILKTKHSKYLKKT